MKNTIEIEVGSAILKIEISKWAKLSNGSALVSYGDNIVLVTANMKEEEEQRGDFFPLIVDYRESNYAAGKIPGGFFKREGKPSEREVLLARLIDRPVRPLFPKNFYNETQIIAMLLSADFGFDYDSLGIIGASAALLASTIPFTTPVAAVKIGWKDDLFTVNPGTESLNKFDMVLQVAGTEKEIVMIEAGGNEFSEDVFKQGLAMAKNIISKICQAQKSLINEDKLKIEDDKMFDDILKQLTAKYQDSFRTAIFTLNKLDRNKKLKALQDEMLQGVEDEEEIKRIKKAIYEIEYQTFRQTLLKDKKRTDGRDFDQIRDISIELGVLPRVHGSAIFTRGETQALVTITLGSEDDAKRIDNLSTNGELKKFMLHYNFPPFSVGEVSFLRGASRRDIGHGNLAEKSLSVVMPDENEFPYTIRIVSEILGSNGSSSMATVCGGTLALMHAGVPIKAPVAGLAMGLVKENDQYVVLTDIAGYEDHFGDMDFKIAGTEKGITAVQLDIKIEGLHDDIIDKVLTDAKKGRMFILGKMREVISAPADKLSEFAPVILTTYINTDKIKDLIGPGGKVIKGLIALYNVKINTEDDGKVTVAAPNREIGDRVINHIGELTQSVELNKVYKGKIVRIEDYGLFVEILNGVVGLLHISEIAQYKIRNIKDEKFHIGQSIEVKVMSIDNDNRMKLSRKVLLDQNQPHPKEPQKPFKKPDEI